MIQKLDLLPGAALKMERVTMRACSAQRSVGQVAFSGQSQRHVKCGTKKVNMNTNVESPSAVLGRKAASAAIKRPVRAAGVLVPCSVRIPVLENNRALLRATRAAELAAWQPALATDRELRGRASLRSEVAQLSRDFRKEAWAYKVLACVSVTAIAYAVISFQVFENLPVVLRAIQQWLV